MLKKSQLRIHTSVGSVGKTSQRQTESGFHRQVIGAVHALM